MNILYIAYSCDPYKGSEDQIGWKIPFESAKNNNVYVITKEEQRSAVEHYLQKNNVNNIKFYFVDIPGVYKKIYKGVLYSGRLNIWQKRAFVLAKKICSNEDIEVIHQLTPVEFRAIGSYGKIKNVKFICGPIGGAEFLPKGLKDYAKGHLWIEFIRTAMNFWSRFVLRITGKIKKCDYIMYANQETKDFLKAKVCHGLMSEIGMDILGEEIVEKENKKKQMTFLVAGRLIYRKGHEYLLDTLKQLDVNLEYECRIVGIGPNMKKLREVCNSEDVLSKHVTFVGEVPYAQMQEEYRNADALIMPSLRETTGSVILEAMAHKLPVITIKKFGGEMILDSEMAWLYSGRNRDEYIQNLLHAIEECISNPQEVKRRGNNAYKKSLDYMWSKKIEQYNQIYVKCRNE